MSNNSSNSDDRTRAFRLTKFTDRPTEIVGILVVSAIGFIVALAWRDAATTVFSELFPDTESSITPRIWYAVITTIVAILVIWLVVRFLEKNRRRNGD